MPADADADELTQAAQIHRRWRGIGALLLVAFYSLFFSLHLKLEKSNFYLHDRSVLVTNTASFFNDLVLPKEHAGAGGTGKGSAFLLLHHAPARLLVAAWKPFSDESAARKHAVATLTASAGAMTVVLLYLTLMWSGMGRLRAALMAAMLGATTAMNLIAVVPVPQVFSALGLAAVLASVARGRSGRWWEFPLAAFYAICCSPWNAVPVALMGLVGGMRVFRGGGGMRPLIGLFGGALVLALLVFGAMMLQEWFYPRASMSLAALMESWEQTFSHAVRHSSDRTIKPAWVVNPVIELVVDASGVSLRDRGVVLAWLLMSFLALIGLVGALRRVPLAIMAALLGLAWCLWFYGTSKWSNNPGHHLLTSHSVPLLIFLVGIGLEQYVKWVRWLRWPATCLLTAFVVLQLLHNAPFNETLATLGKH